MNSIKINTIEKHPKLIDSVLDLHRKNTKTLGFLPKSAFLESMKLNQIIIAIDENKSLCGYILYSINKRGGFAYIVHFCIDENYRGHGLSKKLIKHLVEVTKDNYKGIRVTCRQDYAATNVWAKLGFSIKNEKLGRKKDGSILLIWWLGFNHSDLFSNTESDKIGVVLDSNIVFELDKKTDSKNESTHALVADWLSEDVKYFVTNEFSNDANNNDSPLIREQGRILVSYYDIVSGDYDEFQSTVEKINKYYPKTLSRQDESDIRHLAWTITSNSTFFITNDIKLLKKAEKFFNDFGIMIFNPTEFLLEYDYLKNYTDYQPSRFSGTTLDIKKPTVDETREISDLFISSQTERKKGFKKKLDDLIYDNESQMFLLMDRKKKYLFYTLKKSNSIFEIHFIRICTIIESITIANQVINNIILQAKRESVKLIKISDPFVEERINRLLEKFGFIKYKLSYYKFISSDVIKRESLFSYVRDHISEDEISKVYVKHLKSIVKNNSQYPSNLLVELERLLWPLKFIETNIPCYIVSIRPEWAMNLFYTKLAEGDLFGGDKKLLLSQENAYYRSARQKLPKAPSRILWYINKGKRNTENTMQICAASFVTNSIVDKPKVLYKKHMRLGVFNWDNVYTVAKKDINMDILAFTFDQTELFEKPLNIKKLNHYFNKHRRKDFPFPQAPIRISSNLFFDIYNYGINS